PGAGARGVVGEGPAAPGRPRRTRAGARPPVTLLALAVSGRGLVDPDAPAVFADDEAFLRGRGAFETIRVYRGTPFRLGDHLSRLAASSARLGLPSVDAVALEALVGQ